MKKWLITALAFFMVIITTACSSTPASNSSNSASGSSGSGGGGGQIPIGFSATITGPDSDVNGMVLGARDYLEWVNQSKGGVNGYQFKVTVLDGKYDMNEEIKNFKRFVNVDKAIVVGVWSTGATKALREEINQVAKVPVITCSMTQDVVDPEAYPYIFSLGPSYEDQIKIALMYAQKNGAKKVAFLHNDKEYGTAPVTNVLNEKFAESLGLEVVADVAYPMNATDVSAQLMEIKSQNPDMIYIQDSVNNVVMILRDAQKVGIPAEKFFGNIFAVSPIIIEMVGEHAEGFKAIKAFADFNDQDVQTIKDIIEFKNTTNTVILSEDQYYVKGWVTGMVIEEAVKRALDKNNNQIPDTETFRNMVRDELEALSNFDVGGAIKPVTYSDHKGVTQAKIQEIKGGAYQDITDWIALD